MSNRPFREGTRIPAIELSQMNDGKVQGVSTKHLNPNRKTLDPIFMFARHGYPYCARDKSMLEERRIAFEAVHLGEELTMQGVKAAAGVAKVPQVFIDGKLMGGGCEELAAFLEHK